MNRTVKSFVFFMACVVMVASVASSALAFDTISGKTTGEIRQESYRALNELLRNSPLAAKLAQKAVAILVFPKVYRAGFIVGGQYGQGVLFRNGRINGYYSTIGGSYGLQVGGQSFGYAMFFMTEKSLEYLDMSDGWEIGTGPTVVVVDHGMSGSLSTTKALADVYTFFFNQKGLMAGLGLQGNKITRID